MLTHFNQCSTERHFGICVHSDWYWAFTLARIDYACCTICLLDAFTPSKMLSQMEMMIYNVYCGSQPSPWERKQKVLWAVHLLLCVLCIGSSGLWGLEDSGIIRETFGWSPVRKKKKNLHWSPTGPLIKNPASFITHHCLTLTLLSITWYVLADMLACWFFFSFAVTLFFFKTSVGWSWDHISCVIHS